jgi:hypothetical protein
VSEYIKYFNEEIRWKTTFSKDQINKSEISFSSIKSRGICLTQAIEASKIGLSVLCNNIFASVISGSFAVAINLVHLCTLGYLNNVDGYNTAKISVNITRLFFENLYAIFLNSISFVGFELRAIVATIIHPKILLD